MTEPITPALSEAEWEKQAKRTEAETWKRAQHFALYGMLQQAAALCLYEQPFGFTQEELQALQMLDVAADWFGTEEELRVEQEKHAALIRSVTAKIAALLPTPA